MPETTKAVYAAINAVQRELAATGIGKDRKNEQQGYKFRGIDDVYNAVSSLLAKNGLCIMPRCTSRDVVERTTKSGSALFYVTVRMEFDFVAASDGSTHTAVTFGEAMDSGDKATNKAMSAAYKYALMQAFAIPTEGDNDADATTHEVRSRPISGAQVAKDEYDALPPEAQAVVKEWAADVTALVDEGRADEANAFLHKNCTTQEDKLAIWAMLGSKTRTALKKAAQPSLASQA